MSLRDRIGRYFERLAYRLKEAADRASGDPLPGHRRYVCEWTAGSGGARCRSTATQRRAGGCQLCDEHAAGWDMAVRRRISEAIDVFEFRPV